MIEYFKQSILDDLQNFGVDIRDCNYKSSKNFIKIKDNRIFDSNYGSISLEQFIERHLLDKIDVIDTYESIYDMGNPYELSDDECEDIDLALAIIKLTQPDNGEDYIKKWTNSEDGRDQNAARKAIAANKESAQELTNLFSRSGGYREQLKKYLNLDLNLFDNNILRNKCENTKILFFLYMLRKKHFPKTNVLKLLATPSMENIDNYYLGMKTHNRKIISFIKNSLEKEIYLTIQKKIKDTIQSIVTDWDGFLANTLLIGDYIAGFGHEYAFDKKCALFLLQPVPEKFILKNNAVNYHHSPIETLYLKVLQHEYLGQIKDILKVNINQPKINCNKRLKFVEDMKRFHNSPVDINYLDKYIDENIFKIAKYVYLKEKTNRDEQNRILKSKEKVRRWLDFCIRAKLLINVKANLTELLIISCLQAILDDQEDHFNYTFPLYEDYMKHIPTASSVLKNDKRTLDAFQIYWVRKVMDFWYANIGRYNLKIKFRDLENLCDNILTKILSIPNCDEMLKIHNFYFKKINTIFINNKK